LEEGLLDHAAAMGEKLGEALRGMAARHPCVGDVRGLGLFWTLELVKDASSKEPLRKTTEKYSETIVETVSDYLFKEKNVYVPSDKFGIWVVPPLVVSEEEIAFVVAAIDDALGLADGSLGGS
jgi:taurine--2-oxoglutarate transaminase